MADGSSRDTYPGVIRGFFVTSWHDVQRRLNYAITRLEFGLMLKSHQVYTVYGGAPMNEIPEHLVNEYTLVREWISSLVKITEYSL